MELAGFTARRMITALPLDMPPRKPPGLFRTKPLPCFSSWLKIKTMINVNGDPLEWREGMAVQDILDAKKYIFPMLIVTIDGEHVSKEMYSSVKVPDGANVKVIHMLSGG